MKACLSNMLKKTFFMKQLFYFHFISKKMNYPIRLKNHCLPFNVTRTFDVDKKVSQIL